MTVNMPHILAQTLEHRESVTAAFLRLQKKVQHDFIHCNTPEHIIRCFHGVTAAFSPEFKGKSPAMGRYILIQKLPKYI